MIKNICTSRSNSLKQEFISGAIHLNIFSSKVDKIVTLTTYLRDTQQIVFEVLHQAYFQEFYELTHDSIALTYNFPYEFIAKRDVGPILRLKGR